MQSKGNQGECLAYTKLVYAAAEHEALFHVARPTESRRFLWPMCCCGCSCSVNLGAPCRQQPSLSKLQHASLVSLAAAKGHEAKYLQTDEQPASCAGQGGGLVAPQHVLCPAAT